MKISVIIPTLGRSKEVDSLFGSLSDLVNYEHEVIIVDQNFNSLLDPIVNKYSAEFNIIHCKVDFRGLSKAKNFGVKRAQGEYICFPDDDSEILNSTLSTAISFLDDDLEIGGVFGKCIDREGKDSVIKFYQEKVILSLNNFEGKFVETTMTVRLSILKNHLFDENLGIGAFYGAEEGYDLVYRLLKDRIKLFYNPELKYYHPQVIQNHSDYSALKRVFEYRKGFSYLCVKHQLYKKWILRTLKVCGVILFYSFFRFRKTKFYVVELLSLWSGLLLAKTRQI